MRARSPADDNFVKLAPATELLLLTLVVMVFYGLVAWRLMLVPMQRRRAHANTLAVVRVESNAVAPRRHLTLVSSAHGPQASR